MRKLKSATYAARAIRRATQVHGASIAGTLRRYAWLYKHDFSPHEIEFYDLLDPAFGDERLRRLLSREATIKLDERHVVRSYLCTLSDKAIFYAQCEALQLPIPPLYAVFDKPAGRTGDGRTLQSQEAWCEFFRTLPAPFVVKPALGLLGFGVRAYRPEAGRFVDRDGSVRTVEELYEDIVALGRQNLFTGDYSHHSLGLAGEHHKTILQQQLRAHPAIAALTGSTSLSTCRIFTVVDAEGRPSVLATAMRIIGSDGLTDNFVHGTAGNLWASVDLETGRIQEAFALSADGLRMERRERHPASRAEFGTFVVPLWDEVLDLALRLACGFRPQGVVNWDIAVTEEGVVVIEGNLGGLTIPTPLNRPVAELLQAP